MTRERRYRNKPGSGIFCELFDCDPSRTTESSETTATAELFADASIFRLRIWL